MKFIVSSTYLLKQLQILGGVINNNNTLPILDNFLFDLNKDELTVSASDLETTMSAKLTVESDSEGKIAVPAIHHYVFVPSHVARGPRNPLISMDVRDATASVIAGAKGVLHGKCDTFLSVVIGEFAQNGSPISALPLSR